MRRGEKTPDDLQRPEGNDLLSNYELHDSGEEEFVARCESLGLIVEPWGVDMRHDDGSEGIIYDDAMDFKVYAPGSGEGVTGESERNLKALVDVKTKSSPRYMGRFNERHYVNYYQHAQDFDVPTFVVMFQTDYDTGDIHDEFVMPIGNGELYDEVWTSRSSAVYRFRDGNEAVLVKHRYRRPWSEFVDTIVRGK